MTVAIKKARAAFALFLKSQLRKLVAEQQSKRDVLENAQDQLEKLCRQYLRLPGTTYTEWLELGPKLDYEELLGAASDDACWDRYVDKRTEVDA